MYILSFFWIHQSTTSTMNQVFIFVHFGYFVDILYTNYTVMNFLIITKLSGLKKGPCEPVRLFRQISLPSIISKKIVKEKLFSYYKRFWTTKSNFDTKVFGWWKMFWKTELRSEKHFLTLKSCISSKKNILLTTFICRKISKKSQKLFGQNIWLT